MRKCIIFNFIFIFIREDVIPEFSTNRHPTLRTIYCYILNLKQVTCEYFDPSELSISRMCSRLCAPNKWASICVWDSYLMGTPILIFLYRSFSFCFLSLSLQSKHTSSVQLLCAHHFGFHSVRCLHIRRFTYLILFFYHQLRIVPFAQFHSFFSFLSNPGKK